MEFNYKPNIDYSNLKKSGFMTVQCFKCGEQRENYQIKNFLNYLNKKRLLYDKEITGLYLCRKCSKSVQDTNKIILNKITIGLNEHYKLKENRLKHACKDDIIKENGIKKMLETNHKKYNRNLNKNYNYYKYKQDKIEIANLKKLKNDFKINKQKYFNLLELDILNNKITSLNKKNIIHREFIKKKLELKDYQYIHNFYFENIYKIILNKKIDNNIEIVKSNIKNNKKYSRFYIKRGWIKIYDKLIKYDSRVELSYILYKQEDFQLGKLQRNNQYFYYDDNKRYYPDFYDTENNINIEIKCLSDYNKNNSIINKKLDSCKGIIIFDTDIPKQYLELAKLMIKQYEKSKTD